MVFPSLLKGSKKSKSRRNEKHRPQSREGKRLIPASQQPSSSTTKEAPPVVITERERYVRELESVFRRFDANGDGRITWTELGWIMGSLGQQLAEEELQSMVQLVDSDGDGSIDLSEFIDINNKGVDSTVALDDLRNAFSIFDLDNNGTISCEELHRVLSNLGEPTTMDECQKMINGVDLDGDGMIDFEEFKLMMVGSPWLKGLS